jgi:integrase
VIKAAGNRPFTDITKATLIASRDRRTPAQGRKFLDTMRGLFRWALKAGVVKIDPTVGIDNPPALKTDGFVVWSEDEIGAYEKRWPIGTRQRVWFDVLIYTGLRRGDAVRLGRQHVRDGVATLKTEKTDTVVTLPILPVLAATLAAGPCGDMAFIAGESGRPLAKESFGNLFRDACRAAGLQRRSAHGLRKAAATRAADNGATVAQLEAIFGWQGGAIAALYTRAADRRRLAIESMHKLENKSRDSIAAPDAKVRLLRGKDE